MRKTDAKTLKSCLPQWLREHGLPLHKPFACLNPAHQDAHPSMGYNEKIRRCTALPAARPTIFLT